jgi:hypothetical protein
MIESYMPFNGPVDSSQINRGRRKMLRYLVLAKTKDSFYTLPDERRMVMQGAAMEFIDKLVKQKKAREVYYMSAWRRYVMILELESPEEALRMDLENPMRDYMDMETYELLEWATTSKAMKETYQKLAVKR